MGQQFGRQPRLGGKRLFDSRFGLLADRNREHPACDEPPQRRDGESGQEQLELKRWSNPHTWCVPSDDAGRLLEQFVAELLDGDERVGKRRQLLPQPTHVDVNGPRASRVFVSPDVGEQRIA